MAENESPHPVDTHVGARLRSLRKAAGLSQSELGQVAGLTFQQVQKYERGANRVSASKLFMFAQALGVSPGAFYAGLAANGAEDTAIDPSLPAALDPATVRMARRLEAVKDPVARAHIGKLIERLAGD